MNQSTVHKEVALNDSNEHNKGELILCLFLKVPTGPRYDRETERESVKKHFTRQTFQKLKNNSKHY